MSSTDAIPQQIPTLDFNEIEKQQDENCQNGFLAKKKISTSQNKEKENSKNLREKQNEANGHVDSQNCAETPTKIENHVSEHTPHTPQERVVSREVKKSPNSLSPSTPGSKKKKWMHASPGMASLSPRFKDPNSGSPPPTKYSVQEEWVKDKSPSATFKSTSPRLSIHKNENKIHSPPPTSYNPERSYHVLEEKRSPSSASFRDTSPRFTSNKSDSPPCTYYTPSFEDNIYNEQKFKTPSYSFQSTSPRFKDPKVQSPPCTMYNPYASSFKDQRKSVPFGSSDDRWIINRELKQKAAIPGPGTYIGCEDLPEIYDEARFRLNRESKTD